MINNIDTLKIKVKNLYKIINKMHSNYLELNTVAETLVVEYKKLEEERDELQLTLDLIQSRVDSATKIWQKETGNHNTLPELGMLLDWAMERGERNCK